ncbi:MAG: hypothetical protein R3C12_16905 [Planctomycetaceae bacterium]
MPALKAYGQWSGEFHFLGVFASLIVLMLPLTSLSPLKTLGNSRPVGTST